MAAVDMIPIASSNIEAWGWDAKAREMHVRFKSGAVFAYAGVPGDVRRGFDAADSKGSFFAQNIKGKFEGRRVDRVPDADKAGPNQGGAA